MNSTSTKASGLPTAGDPFIPVELARGLIRRRGRPIARQTVFSLGVRRELDVQMIAGRFVVTRESIDAYRARHGLTTQPGGAS